MGVMGAMRIVGPVGAVISMRVMLPMLGQGYVFVSTEIGTAVNAKLQIEWRGGLDLINLLGDRVWQSGGGRGLDTQQRKNSQGDKCYLGPDLLHGILPIKKLLKGSRSALSKRRLGATGFHLKYGDDSQFSSYNLKNLESQRKIPVKNI